VLHCTGALAATGLAGCIGGRADQPDDTPTNTPSDLRYSFTVSVRRCGNQENRADVTFGDGIVTVEGTTWGNNACYTGRLESVTYDDGTLTIQIDAVNAAEPGQACAECISEIDYHGTVEVPSTPNEVVVIHRGETVATVSP